MIGVRSRRNARLLSTLAKGTSSPALPIDKITPIIWGQQTGYLYIQLRDFKRGDRKSEIMQPIASSFEKDDMLAIAEFFSKKPWPDLGQPRSPKDVAARALSAQHSVGCTGCHLGFQPGPLPDSCIAANCASFGHFVGAN